MFKSVGCILAIFLAIPLLASAQVPIPSAPVLSFPANNTVNYSTYTLSWNASSFATDYEVQLSTDTGFGAGTVLFDSTLKGTSVNLLSVVKINILNYQGIKFYWRVNAQNTSGISPWSAVWNFTTTFPTLTLVSPLNSASGVSLTPTLLWRKISAAAFYRVQASTDSTFTNSAKMAVDDSLVTDTSKILASLAGYADSVIYWHVRAKNAAGVSSNWSLRWMFSTGTMPVPSAPVLSFPANNTVNYSTYTLSWNASSFATDYEVQLSTDIGFGAGTVLFDSTLKGTSVNLLSVVKINILNYQGIKFYWRVNAQNTSGISPWSAVWNFTTTFPTLTLVSPLNGASGVSLTPTLLWRKISAAAFYRVQASTDSTFTNSAKMAVDDSLVTDTSKILASLAGYADSVIYWHVRAKNAAGVSSNWSLRWMFSTGTMPVPSAPVLSFPANNTVNYSTYTLSWNASSFATDYEVQLSTDIGFGAGTVLFDSTLKGTSVNLLSVVKINILNYQGIKFYWRVNAQNTSGISPWSAVWNFTTAFPTLTLVSPLNGASGVSLTPTLLWRKISAAAFYRVQASTDSTFTNSAKMAVDDSLVTDTSKILASLAGYADSVIYWHVRAKNAAGVSSNWSLRWMFSTGTMPVPSAPVLLFPANNTVNFSAYNLAWKASSSPVTNFEVQLSTDLSFGAGTVLFDSTLTGTGVTLLPSPWSLFDLRNYPGIKFYWRVNARNASGMSSWSAVWNFTTAFVTVTLVSPINDALGVSLTPTLLWRKISAAAFYRVQASTDSTFTNSAKMAVDDSLVTDTSKTLGSLSACGDSLIYWRVRAKNAAGVSGNWSQRWAFSTTAPSVFLVDDFESGYSDNKIGTYWYFWSDSSSIIHNAGPENKFIGGYQPGNASTYAGIMDFTVKGGSSYTEAGMGINFDNAKNPVDLTGATAVRFDIKANRSMVVRFRVPQSTITDFAYYYANISATASWTTVTVNLAVGANGLSKPTWGNTTVPFAIDKLFELNWVYQASDNPGADSSGMISIDNVKIIGNPVGLKAPFPPIVMYPGWKSKNIPSSPTVLWRSCPGATAYHLQISTVDTMNSSYVVNQSNITDTAYTVSPLSLGTTYYWRVNVTAGSVTSRWSSIIPFSTVSQPKIVVTPGWNMISLNIHPEDSSAQGVFDSLHGFVLAKNNTGLIYWPVLSINTLGGIHTGSGYKVYTDSLDTLQCIGSPVDVATTPIALSAGWNLAAFLPQADMPITSALAGIVSEITIVKDNFGQVYWPDCGINTIGDMVVGQGYKMHMKNAATLTYPSGSIHKMLAEGKKRTSPPPSHYLYKRSTGNNMTILLKQVLFGEGLAPDNSEVGAFDEQGNIVGCGVVTKGKAALSIWGDDPQTKAKDGCILGEPLSFKLWNGAEEFPVEYQGRGLLKYQEDGIMTGVFSVPEKMFIKNFALKTVSPNPFRTRTMIQFDVPARHGPDKLDVEINVYSLNGGLMYQIVKGKFSSGHYSATWNAGSKAASGSNVYIIRMKAVNFVNEIKLFRMK